MLGETEKSSDVCRTASLSELGHEQRAATSYTVTDQRRKNFFVRRQSLGKYWQLNQNNQKTEQIQWYGILEFNVPLDTVSGHFGDRRTHTNYNITQTNGIQKVDAINSKHSQWTCTERGQTQPGLVTFYHILQGNGTGLLCSFNPRVHWGHL